MGIVAGYEYGSKSIVAPFEYSGYTDTSLFTSWFAEQLLLELRDGQVVLLDNASFHTTDMPLLGIAPHLTY